MTTLRTDVLSPVVFQLAALLERYQADFEKLIQRWSDRDLWREVARQLAEIVSFRGTLPQLAVDIADIALHHMKIVESLGRAAFGPQARSAETIAQLRKKHETAVRSARDKCLKLLAVDG
jgi:hypothetical protein